MTQVLIVDDESLIVEDIKSSVNWEKLRISEVFTAFGMQQAKEVFLSNTIDIMLCDIEMPQGSGLELLSWVRENYPKTESIFLTCHADFAYAKEAVRLGSFDYILKPIPYAELETVIMKAMDKIRKNSRLEEYSRFGQFWFKHQHLLIEHFWLDILNHTIPSSQEAIKKAADLRDIPYTEQIKILPVLISVQRWYEEHSLQDEKIMEFGLINIAEEMLAAQGEKGRFFQLRRGTLIGILTVEDSVDADLGPLAENCRSYIVTCNKYLHCDLSCYVGNVACAHELASMVDKLSVLEKNNVAFYNKVFLLKEQAKPAGTIDTMDMSVWATMLKEGSVGKIVSEVEKYLNQLVMAMRLDANMLYQFQQDFDQMIYSVLEQKSIQVHQLLNDSKSMELHALATHSVMEMIEWVKHIVGKAVEYTSEVEKTQSTVNKAMKYIRLNLDRGLTREKIASHVFLNPDYLDRIFKKETGVSVARFIAQERLNVAQELLSKTEIPISTIAASVGYSNLSSFSIMFKKLSGMKPFDYRKRAIKGKV